MSRSERIEAAARALVGALNDWTITARVDGYRDALRAALREWKEARPVSDYDMSIHRNTDAAAWAKFFCETWRKIHPDQPVPDEGWMLGWFANAMMAMHDAGPAPAVAVDVTEKEEDDAVYLLGHRAGAEWMREQAAALCERVRCRVWTPEECAAQVRRLPTSPPAPEVAK